MFKKYLTKWIATLLKVWQKFAQKEIPQENTSTGLKLESHVSKSLHSTSLLSLDPWSTMFLKMGLR